MSVTTVQLDHTSDRYALSIGGKVYGPYNAHQIKAYVAEGRVTAASLISREGGAWIAASDDALCGEWLASVAAGTPLRVVAPVVTTAVRPSGPPLAPSPRPPGMSARDAFLKELEGVRLKTPTFGEAKDGKPAPTPPAAVRPSNAAPALDTQAAASNEVQSANMVLVFDLKSRGHGKLEEDIMSIGPATKVMSGVWLLHTELSSGAVRNALMKHFGANDTMFIVDASRDKTTWFNLGPEVDSHIRKVWRRS